MSKLSDLRKSKAPVAKAETKILPDLTAPKGDNGPVTAITTESRAAYFAAMATAPLMPTGADVGTWYAGLTERQQAAYQFESDVDTTLAASDDVARSPLVWYFDLLAVYTDGDKCLLDDFPIPDTKTGNNPAISEETGRKKDGTSGLVKVDFYDKLARSLSHGKKLQAQLDSLKAAAPTGGNPAKVSAEHRMLTEDQRAAKLETLNKRWQRFRATVKDAIWIRLQWAAIKALLSVELDYVYDVVFDDQGNEIERTLTDGTLPFVIWQKGKDKAAWSKTYTVSNFLKLDPAKAAKAGGTCKALIESVARGTGSDATPQGNKPSLTFGTVWPSIHDGGAFWLEQNNQAAMLSAATKEEGKSGALTDDQVLSLGWNALGYDGIFKHIAPRFKRLEMARDAADKAARESKINQAAG
jgi:hypothetical protein